ncbi:MAG: diaminopimelate epimerase [Proteocatella sp.]
MNLKYTKINGNGNNFLVMDNRELKLDDETKSKLTIRDCNVKTSIGADGLIFVEASQIADFRMRIYNVDGSEAEMCGNGARCIARFAYDSQIAGDKMAFQTEAGIMKAQIIKEKDDQGNEIDNGLVSIDMGEIDLAPLQMDKNIVCLGKDITYSYLPVGVPHVAVYCEENAIETTAEMIKYGNAIDKSREVFKQGTNVNFIEVIDQDNIKVTTFERGVDDLTDSCGTGSCSSTIINAIKNKSQDGSIPENELNGLSGMTTVQNPGGINKVNYSFNQKEQTCSIKLIGKVVTVARVEMLLD